MHKKHIGILGGMFDPVHKVHINLAQAAFENTDIDELVFVPAHQAPLKDVDAQSTDAQRLEMLNLALCKFPYPYSINTYEMDRPQIGYAIDTARYLTKEYPNSKLSWIIGGDHIEKLAKWKAPQELCKLVDFICAMRGNMPFQLHKAPPFANIFALKFEPVECSSTDIRNSISTDMRFAKTMLDESVFNYIITNKIYKKR